MSPSEIVRVTGPGGLRGTIDTNAWPLNGSRADILVQVEGGTPVLVPLEALIRQDDGSYCLCLDPAERERRRPAASSDERTQSLVLPVLQEELEVGTRVVETGRVRIQKLVHEREELVDPPLQREEVVVERVPVNRIVEGPVAVRSEGDTLIIPLLEEVLVVEKRLLLKEELHLTKRQVEVHSPQRVRLRREEAVIERIEREDDNDNSSS